MIKVSIIVPVYNVESFLEKCLDSLVNQSLKEIEIIVVNDGSTDNSQVIIDKYVKLYPNIVKSFEKINGGLSDTRNFGLKYCNGEYIGFVDSDDYISSEMYEKMYLKAKSQNSEIVVCDYYKVYENHKELVKAKEYKSNSDAFVNMLAAAWNKIYKKELLINSNIVFPKGLIYEDTEFFLKLIPHIKKMSYVPEPLVFYVQRAGSIANTQGVKTAQIFDILNNILIYYKENDFYDKYYTELEYIYARILLCSSMERVCKIRDKNLRKKLVRDSYQTIETNFPNWKQNKYLQNIKCRKHTYMRFINYHNILLVSSLIYMFFLIKDKKLFRK